MALYRLAVFHDNNGREGEAIPHYRRALALGLDGETKVRAVAWLASSLYKNGRLGASMRYTEEALSMRCPADLRGFLLGLQKRVRRKQDGGRG